MRKLFAFVATLFLLFSCDSEPQGNNYLKKMKKYRYQMNVTFSDKNTSPLKPEDLKDFKSLDFFPVDTIYKVKAKFKPAKNAKFMSMKTNTSEVVPYKLYGVATFKIGNKEHKLNLYQYQQMDFTGEFEERLFLPFHDTTNGKETYEGGRYIDVKIPRGKKVVIDFNKAYNPYCVYNEKYVCPVVPAENTLEIPIYAGVKNFKK
ncbi:DUF1684 domain-containing protein [Aureivirga marina]|uniref:DUF1684 domain-containing protein n=1 Tax=Aureivirga marina TaxID=1182451 RepID=UPI001E2B1F89|nr:DUF1684 domain-containing protein [Aureivirga marina]